ncbi:Major Facilitator Superfamily protein [compost metagenome]
MAAILLRIFLPRVTKTPEKTVEKKSKTDNVQSAYKDKIYLSFIFFVTLYAICFFQMFTIIPGYYKEVVHLEEWQIGLVMAMNGILIAIIEMVMVYKLEGRRSPLVYIGQGTLLLGSSFLMFNLFGPSATIVVIGMLAITFGEMLSMPFMNSFWISRSSENNRGQYAALYTIAYSIAQVLSPTLGSRIVQHYGFTTLWYVISGMAAVIFIGFRILKNKIESTEEKVVEEVVVE